MTVVIFLIVLAILIFVHELGHFLFAKLSGIRVDAFKIGFGPKLMAWTIGETEYGINLIPFGGFVKIFGENPDDTNTYGPDKARSFVHKNRLQQVLVLVAGVLFNFLFAWLLYVIVFTSGVTATTDGFEQYVSRFTNQRIMITYVEPGSPAEKAGLAMGDVIQSVGSPIALATTTTPLTVEYIQNTIASSSGSALSFGLLHRDQPVFVQISPEFAASSATSSENTGKYMVGIAMSNVVDLQLPFLTSIGEGFRYTLVMIRDTTIGLYTFVTGIFSGTAKLSDVSGPVGIAGIVGNAASLGFKYLIMITALISINLGVINLIPFPALDGGRVLFVILEGIFRRRISPKFTNTVNAVGFVLLMILMVAVTYKDILKLVQG